MLLFTNNKPRGMRKITFFLAILNFCIAIYPGYTKESVFFSERTDLSKHSISWAKPIKGKPIKILAILPQTSSQDVIELRKRLDAEIYTIYTENSFNLGCDPLWGEWCPENERAEYKRNLAYNKLNQKWDALIIAGIDISILPSEFWEKILICVKEGSGLILIPYRNPSIHPIAELIRSLEEIENPTKKWELLCTGDNEFTKKVKHDIYIHCLQLEKGRVVYIENYLDGMESHSLIPDFVKGGGANLYENAWAGLISLVLWSANKEGGGEIINVEEGTPKGPTEEEIPPELINEDLLSYIRPVLSSVLTPFRIEYVIPEKSKADKIRVRVRRENFSSAYEEYEFKISLNRKSRVGVSTIELPIGCSTYFLDVLLLEKDKVLDFTSRRFSHFSFPNLESVATSKNFVYPHDSIMVKVNITPSQVEKGDASIVAQAYDLVISDLFPEGKLVVENVKHITSKGGEVEIPIRFADLNGNYLRIKVWGIPFKINKLGINYSSMFSLQVIELPVIRKIPKKQCNDFLVVDKVEEINEMNTLQNFSQIFNAGIYIPIENVVGHLIRNFGSSVIFDICRNYEYISAEKGNRIPCFNDDSYLEKTLMEIQEKLEDKSLPTPAGISLGLNASLTKLEEPICFCHFCAEKFNKILDEEHHKNVEDTLAKIKEDLSQCSLTPKVLFHRKFMEDSLLNFFTGLKNRCKLSNPEVPTGLGIYGGKEIYTAVNYEDFLKSVDWVAIDPSEFSLRILPSFYHRKGRLYYKIDFNDPEINDEYLTYVCWKSLLEGGEGIFLVNALGKNEYSSVVKTITSENRLNPELKSFFINLQQRKNTGLIELLSKLKPDYNEDVAIYYSQENVVLSGIIKDLNTKASAVNFMRILNGFGINPIVVSKNDLNKLNSLKILIIPSCIYLRTEELEAISEFLEKGGIVVADYMPGIANENDLEIKSKFEKYLQDNDLTTKGSKSIIEKFKEKGKKVIVVGKELSLRWENIDIDTIREILGGFAILLKDANIKSPFNNSVGEDDWIWADGKLYSFNDEQILMWHPNYKYSKIFGKSNLPITINEGKYVYDIQTGKILNRGKAKDVKINPEKNSFLSILPYEVEKIDVILSKEIKTGQRITGNLKILKTSKQKNVNFVKHYLWVTLATDREGKNIIHSELLETNENGEAIINIPTYLNQPMGWYLLTIREMYTGIRNQFWVKLQ